MCGNHRVCKTDCQQSYREAWGRAPVPAVSGGGASERIECGKPEETNSTHIDGTRVLLGGAVHSIKADVFLFFMSCIEPKGVIE